MTICIPNASWITRIPNFKQLDYRAEVSDLMTQAECAGRTNFHLCKRHA